MESLVFTREQAENLQKLGLDMSDAIFCWAKYEDSEHWYIHFKKSREYLKSINSNCKMELIPTYTLQEAFNKMPDCFMYRNKLLRKRMNGYCVHYYWYDINRNDEYIIIRFFEPNLLTQCYRMLVWLLENGYIKSTKPRMPNDEFDYGHDVSYQKKGDSEDE